MAVDEATVDAMADFARLPYCGAVPGPYSPKAEQYSQAFCEGDPPGVQDADHAYDLRHDSTMGLIGVHTYYAQALLKCFEELTGADDAFKLCVVEHKWISGSSPSAKSMMPRLTPGPLVERGIAWPPTCPAKTLIRPGASHMIWKDPSASSAH